MQYDIEKQHAKGKLHAIERIHALVDKGSFAEICTVPYDGVITGFGTVNGRKLALYAQDFTVQGGSLGKVHGDKITGLVKQAIEEKCPVVGINDSGGARIQEGVDSLAGYSGLFYQNVRASGFIPQISIIAGPCAGGAVYSSALMDFVFTVDEISYMFVTGPKVIKSVMFLDITEAELGGPLVHAQKSGAAHFRSPTEADCYAKVKKLLDYIPHYYDEKTPPREFTFSQNKLNAIEHVLPERCARSYDVRTVIDCVADDGSFFEVTQEFAVNIVTGFARIEGKTIGVIANNPAELGGVLNCDASDKASRFIRYCDAFNIPLLTFVDIPGFIPGPEEEQKGIIRHGAKLIYAYAEATVPKVTVITRKAYGGAYIAMCSKHLGADFVFAWPKVEIAVMGAEYAVQILYAKKLKENTNPAFYQEKIQEYRDTVMTPRIALERGYISQVIEMRDTRGKAAECFRLLADKQAARAVTKKHGNMPV